MLIAALAIWLIVVFLSVGFCRVAASADSRELALIARYLSPSAGEPLSDERPSSSRVSPLTYTAAPRADTGGVSHLRALLRKLLVSTAALLACACSGLVNNAGALPPSSNGPTTSEASTSS